MSRLAVSSAHLIENAVICSSQMFMGRTSERRKEGETILVCCQFLQFYVASL